MFSFKKCISRIVMTLCVSGFSTAVGMGGMVENSSPIKSNESFSEFHSDINHITMCSPDCTGDNVEKGIQINDKSKKNTSCCVFGINGEQIQLNKLQNMSLGYMKHIVRDLTSIVDKVGTSFQIKMQLFQNTLSKYKFALLMRHGSTLDEDGAYKAADSEVACSSYNVTHICSWKGLFTKETQIITSELSRAKNTGEALAKNYGSEIRLICESDKRLNELTLPKNYKNMPIDKMLEDKEVQRMCLDHSYNMCDGESVQKKAEDVADCIRCHLNSTTTKNIISQIFLSRVFVSHSISIGSFVSEYSNGFNYAGKIEREGVVCPPVTQTLYAVLIAYNSTNGEIYMVAYPLASSDAKSVNKLCMAFLEKKTDEIFKEAQNNNG